MAMIRKIYKVNIKDLKEANYNLELDYNEALENEQVIGIGNSQVVAWLNQLHGKDEKTLELQYREIKGKRSMAKTRAEQKELTQQMREMEFIPELVQVQFNVNKAMEKDFDRTCEGFTINGVKYVWFASKGSSVVTYIDERIAEDFRNKLDNGRDKSVKFIPAKLNAYLSLSMSSSRKIPQPTGKVVLVHDAETKFLDTYLSVTTKGVKEVTEEVTLDASDGYGLINPSYMQTISDYMGYNGKMSSGVTIRNAYCKGLVVPFPFDEFFKEHGITEIKDAYGNIHSVDSIDMILTTSMVKAWNCYSSFKEYENNCKANGYEYRVCKESHEVEYSRANYQMTTDLEMTSQQIERLLQPSVDHIANITSRDWLSTVLYLNGECLNENSTSINSLSQALMVEPKLLDDIHTLQTLRKLTDKRKKDLCLGRFNVSSSYQICTCDPYLLCESICGLEHKGLLCKDEVWSKHHVDKGSNEVLLFRAPMISKENIKRSKIVTNSKIETYYRYMTELVVISGWDLTCATLAGMDFDGDTCMMLDDEVLLEVQEPTLPVFCEALKGEKVLCDTLQPLLDGSKLGLNDKAYNIGSCINKITNMFSVRSQFPKDSREYKEISDRILLGLCISQSYIDFKKLGQVVMEMPKHWYNLKECDLLDCSEEEREFQKNICADSSKKPYFFLYNPVNERYKTKMKDDMESFNIKCLINFGMELKDLLKLDESELTDEMKLLITLYDEKAPIFIKDNSTQHRMCLKAEEMLKQVSLTSKSTDNRELLKCSDVVEDEDYKRLVRQAKRKYRQMSDEIRTMFSKGLYSNTKELKGEILQDIRGKFILWLLEECVDERQAVNVAIDCCYDTGLSVQVVWDTEWIANIIINNLLERNDYKMSIPVKSEDGEHEYLGKKFKVVTVQVER